MRHLVRERIVFVAAFLATAPMLAAQSPAPPIDLTGDWVDSGRLITITVTGKVVTAVYKEDHVCDPQDGSPKQTTRDDFIARIAGEYPRAGMELTGEITVCAFGSGNPCGIGFMKTALNLKVSADGQRLEGTLYDCVQKKDVPLTITRINCPDVKKQLEDAANKSPLELLRKCEELDGDLVLCASESAHYCAKTTCFEQNEVHIGKLDPAQAPGVVSIPGYLASFILPQMADVLTLYRVEREPVIITRDICANMLGFMRKADEYMSSSGMGFRHQEQTRAIDCLRDFCRGRGWRTE